MGGHLDSQFARPQTGSEGAPPEWTPSEWGRSRRPDPLTGFFFVCAVIGVVAIFVFVVLWLLTGISCDAGCGTSKPYVIVFGTPSASNASGVYFDTIPIVAVSAGLTTSIFGLKITNSSNLPEPSTTQTGACTVGTAVTGCTISLVCKTDCWYAVLVGQNENTLGEYEPSSVGGSPAWSSMNLDVDSADSLVVVTGGGWFVGGDFTLSAFGAGAQSVSGQTTL